MHRLLKKTTSYGRSNDDKPTRRDGTDKGGDPRLVLAAFTSTALFVVVAVSEGMMDITGGSGGFDGLHHERMVEAAPPAGGAVSNNGGGDNEGVLTKHPGFYDDYSKFEPGLNIPNPYYFPWQYGLRAEDGVGGNDDQEVMQSIPQGDEQPLVREVPLGDYSRTSMSNDRFVDRQMVKVRGRFYDSLDMLQNFITVKENQKGVTKGVPQPIEVVRGSEDGLPSLSMWDDKPSN